MEIEVAPGKTDQKPNNATKINVSNNTNQKGSYQILPDGMDIEINGNTAEPNKFLTTNSTEFKNTGGVTLNIQWL